MVWPTRVPLQAILVHVGHTPFGGGRSRAGWCAAPPRPHCVSGWRRNVHTPRRERRPLSEVSRTAPAILRTPRRRPPPGAASAEPRGPPPGRALGRPRGQGPAPTNGARARGVTLRAGPAPRERGSRSRTAAAAAAAEPEQSGGACCQGAGALGERGARGPLHLSRPRRPRSACRTTDGSTDHARGNDHGGTCSLDRNTTDGARSRASYPPPPPPSSAAGCEPPPKHVCSTSPRPRRRLLRLCALRHGGTPPPLPPLLVLHLVRLL